MTPLTFAMRNELAKDPSLAALLGSSTKWPQWVFMDKPSVAIENTGKALIVVLPYEPWASMNRHNTQQFPTVIVDIWADPTRNADKSIMTDDAEMKIDAIEKLVLKHFHTANLDLPGGQTLHWGTATQVSSKTGVWVNGSHLIDGPRYRDVANVPGAKVASYRFGVNVVS